MEYNGDLKWVDLFLENGKKEEYNLRKSGIKFMRQ